MALDNGLEKGQRILLTVKGEDGGDADQFEATVESVNEMGVLVRRKGRAALKLYAADDVIETQVLPEKPKTLKPKRINPLKLGAAREHLVLHHGYKIADIQDRSEEWALEFHNSQIDHEGLGHFHAEAKKQEGDAGE